MLVLVQLVDDGVGFRQGERVDLLLRSLRQVNQLGGILCKQAFPGGRSKDGGQPSDRIALHVWGGPFGFSDDAAQQIGRDQVDTDHGQSRYPVEVQGALVVVVRALGDFPAVEPELCILAEGRLTADRSL